MRISSSKDARYMLFTNASLLISSDGPRMSAAGLHTVTDSDCMQEFTVSLQQPVPDELYYAFSSEHTDSCVGLRKVQAVDITTDNSELMLTVYVGDSGLDTRQRMYLISWFVMQDTMGPCSNVPLQRTGWLERSTVM